MPDIRLVRVDFRLMHGQVVTAWLKQVSANAILIVDDQLAADKFLALVWRVYREHTIWDFRWRSFSLEAWEMARTR